MLPSQGVAAPLARQVAGAYEQPTYEQAKGELDKLQRELRLLNESAVRSLQEGLEETLTLHRLGVFRGAGAEPDDHEHPGVDHGAGGGSGREGGPLAEQFAEAALAGHSLVGHRATAAPDQGLSCVAEVAASASTHDEEGGDGCLMMPPLPSILNGLWH